MEGKAMTLMRRTAGYSPSFPSLLDRFFEGDLMDWYNWNFAGNDSTMPAVNIRESDNEYMIEVAAPGMKKSDFKVNYDNGRLAISSEHKEEKKDKEGDNYTRREFSYQSFQRTFNISENLVEGDKINAKYNDGILTITLPKREEVKPKPVKEIKIS
jgi:HSP20 family protein